MADNVEIQGLEFQIVGNAEEANRGLKALTSTLKRLQGITSKGLGLTAVANDVRQFNEAVGEMDTTGITSMADAIRTIGSSARMLSTVRGHLQAISDLNFGSLTQAANAIGTVAAAATQNNPINTPLNPAGGAIAPETDTFEGSTQTVEQASAAMREATNVGTRLKEILTSVGSKFKHIGSTGAKAIAKGVTYPFYNSAKSISTALKGADKFMASLKRIAMYRIVRTILSGITAALKAGIGHLNMYSKTVGTTFHQSLNMIATDALYMKNSLAAAIAPIVNAFAPAIDFLADKVANLLNLLSQLFAKLSGANTYTKAVKTATEYSDSISKAAANTKSFTAGFDELNVFDPNSGGGAGSVADYASMFEEATVDGEIASFADRLKELFKSGSWAELGIFIGEKFNEAVDSVSWDKLGTKIGKGFNGAIQTAYGFMKTVDFKNVGKNIAKALNNAIENIDFETFGRLIIRGYTAVVDTIGGLLGDLNWRSLGAAVGNYLRGAFNEAADWLASVDWGQLGSKLYSSLKDVVVGIDFGGIAKSFFKALGSALGAAVSLLATFCVDVWADIREYFSTKIEECGGDIPAGLWKGIKDGFKNVVSWIKENMVDPFVEGFKKCFGIHSPSTVMEELGTYVVQGFFKGIEKFSQYLYKVEEWVDAVVEWFRKGEDGKGVVENFKELASNIVTSFKDKIGTTYTTVKTNVTTWASKVKEWYTNSSFGGINRTTFSNYANEVISGFREKIGTTYTTVKTNITTWASNVRDWFTNSSFGAVNRTTFATFADNVVSGFREKIGSVYTTVKSNIVTWASNVRDWFTSSSYGGVNATNFSTYANNIVTGFKDKISSTYSTVKSSITTWASNVRDWFTNSSYGGVNYSNFSTYAGNVISGFKDKISSSYSNVKSSITSWASDVKSWFTSTSYGGVCYSTFSTYAANVISGFKDKIGSSYTDAKSNMQTFASNVKSWFTGTVSYNAFYNVASDVISGFKNGIGNLYSTCKNTIKNWGSDIIEWFKDVLGINSPSRVFYQMADFSVQGFNKGFNQLGTSTKSVVGNWAKSFTDITPTLGFAMDTSALKYYDSASFAKNITPNVNSNHNFTAVGFMEAMQEFYHEYMEPTLLQMADDMRRQADKPEQTIVQVGNRTITDAVTTQQKANGYKFTTA